MIGDMLENAVENADRETLNTRVYNLTIGFFVIYGMILTTFLCYKCGFLIENWSRATIIIAYLIVGWLGCDVMCCSDNSVVSFIGYNMIIAPIGLLLSTTVPNCDIETVIFAAKMTVCITLCMIVVSAAFPEKFENLGFTLVIALLAILILEPLSYLLGIYNGALWDYIAIALFALCIAFYWSNAQLCPKNLNNAIVNAGGIYLAMIDIFLRVLSRSSSSKK